MSTAYLLLGSNQGNRQTILQQAIGLLNEYAGMVVTYSKVYETAAWGKTDQPGFLNQALLLETVQNPETLLSTIHFIEQRLGRQRYEKWGQRTLDIDILFFDEMLIDTPELHVPHPELPNRRFALTPLCEIAPSLVHPGLNLSIRHLLGTCTDPLEVSVFIGK